MGPFVFSDIHQAKCELISLGLPAELAIDFGPTFRPQYINYCAKNGAENTLAIDAHKAVLDDGIDFHRADFSRDSIVDWVEDYRGEHPGDCLGISFDTLLHQYSPLHVLMNLLGVLDRACIGSPILKDRDSEALFLPAILDKDQGGLFPKKWMTRELNAPVDSRFAPIDTYSWANWLWGLNENLLKIWIERQGFEVQEERRIDRPGAWMWYGCLAVKK